MCSFRRRYQRAHPHPGLVAPVGDHQLFICGYLTQHITIIYEKLFRRFDHALVGEVTQTVKVQLTPVFQHQIIVVPVFVFGHAISPGPGVDAMDPVLTHKHQFIVI